MPLSTRSARSTWSRRASARTVARLLLAAIVLSLPGCIVLTCRI